MSPHDDLPRDEHLRQALRHAPDGDRHAPALLSASILAAARREAATAPRPWRLGMQGFRGLPWQGAGTLAAVVLVSGVLWVQREALPPAVEPGEPAGAPAETPSETPAVPPAATAPAAPNARGNTTAPPGPILPTAKPPAVPPAALTTAPVPTPGHPARAARQEAATPAPAPAAAGRSKAAAADAAMAPAAEPVSEPAGERAAEQAAQPVLASAKPTAPPPPLAAARQATPAMAPGAPAPPLPTSFDAYDAWSPTTAGAQPRAWPAGWLQAFRAATPGWSEASPEHLAEAGLREIALWKLGQAQARLRLGRQGVVWCAEGLACQVSAADPAALAALRQSLPPD